MSSGEAGIKLGHSTALQLLMMALHLTNHGQGLKALHSHNPVHTLPNTTIASQVGAARDHLHLQKQLGVAAALHLSVAGKRRKQQGMPQGNMQGPQQGLQQQGPQQQGNMQTSQQGQPQGQQQQGQQQGGQQQQGQQQQLSESLVHVMLVTTQEQV